MAVPDFVKLGPPTVHFGPFEEFEAPEDLQAKLQAWWSVAAWQQHGEYRIFWGILYEYIWVLYEFFVQPIAWEIVWDYIEYISGQKVTMRPLAARYALWTYVKKVVFNV